MVILTILLLLLQDIWDHFKEAKKDRLTTLEILSRLHQMEERSWPDWYGKAISSTSVAKLLKPFGIKPGRWKDSGQSERGYLKKDFIDPALRFLHDAPDTTLKNKALDEYLPDTENEKVSGDKDDNSFKNKAVSSGSTQNPVPTAENKDCGNNGNPLFGGTL